MFQARTRFEDEIAISNLIVGSRSSALDLLETLAEIYLLRKRPTQTPVGEASRIAKLPLISTSRMPVGGAIGLS